MNLNFTSWISKATLKRKKTTCRIVRHFTENCNNNGLNKTTFFYLVILLLNQLNQQLEISFRSIFFRSDIFIQIKLKITLVLKIRKTLLYWSYNNKWTKMFLMALETGLPGFDRYESILQKPKTKHYQTLQLQIFF